MKIELSTYEAANILLEDEFANWSHNAALAIIEYYEGLEEDLGESIDLDRVAIRGDWSEYKSVAEAVECYDEDWEEGKKRREAALAYFKERTNVITCEGGLLIQPF